MKGHRLVRETLHTTLGKWLAVVLLATFGVQSVKADTEAVSSLANDSTSRSLADETLGKIKKTVRGFSAIDTNYIEPQHYNYALMLQTTINYDMYWLKSNSGQKVMLSPDAALRVGPYFGWRWLFLGYTFELKNIGVKDNKLKKEFALSLYSSQIGVDLFYRRTGNDYKIRKSDFGDKVDVSKLKDVDFDGLNVGITGFNLYYIFNHNRFSYPAAFSQSTIQKISCGSWLAGIGYTRQSLDLDHEKLREVVERNCDVDVRIDSSLMFNSVKYYDLNISAGYAYNWVFAKNWLFCSSVSGALAYKRSQGNVGREESDDFTFKNFNLDGIIRLGLVYNNMRWYAGSSVILHSYNYHKSRFSTNNIFGSLNVYVGMNFGLKKGYKKQEKKKNK